MNLFGILPYAGINLALYETLKDAYLIHQFSTQTNKKTIKYKNEEDKNICDEISGSVKRPPALVLLSIGTVSSSCGQIVVYPLALVRTKLQVITHFYFWSIFYILY